MQHPAALLYQNDLGETPLDVLSEHLEKMANERESIKSNNNNKCSIKQGHDWQTSNIDVCVSWKNISCELHSFEKKTEWRFRPHHKIEVL